MSKVDFSEIIYKMDKWASEDFDDQARFYEIVDDETLSKEQKIEEIEDFLDILVCDWERLESYMEIENGEIVPYTDRELAEALVNYFA